VASQTALNEKRKNVISGFLCFGHQPTVIARHYGYTVDFVRYWIKKFLNPGFHSGEHGGDHRGHFSPQQQQILMIVIIEFLKIVPTADLAAVTKHVALVSNQDISKSTVARLLHKHRWSWKVPTRFQIQKYSAANLIRYLNYLQTVQQIPPSKLKFADESHLVSKDLTKRTVLGMKCTRVYVKEKTLHEAHASLTVLVSHSGAPITFDYREESNTQWNFTDFVLHCCITGALEAGDYLIVDNAAVHNGWDSMDIVQNILDVAGVSLIFLPAYSPELNPCELVFQVVKSHIRCHRKFGSHILQEVVNSLALVTSDAVQKFYSHCLHPNIILPEMLI